MKEKVLKGLDDYPEPEIPGDTARIAALIKKIRQEGGTYTIGVLGGSITQGSGASAEPLSYGYKVYQWWVKNFPEAKFTFVNAGIGGTNPEMGCYRFDREIGNFHPDFAVLDYADNTYLDSHLDVTVPTLLYKMLSGGAAVMSIYFSRTDSAKYSEGVYEQAANIPIPEKKLEDALRDYAIPTVNYHAYVWEKIHSGVIDWPDIGSDYIHPNNNGHTIGAAMITAVLDKIAADPDKYTGEITEPALPKKDTYLNAYSIVKGDARVTLAGAMNADEGDKAYTRGWNCAGGREGSLTVTLPEGRKHAKLLMTISGSGTVTLSGGGTSKKLQASDAQSPTLIQISSTLGDTVTVTSMLDSGGRLHIFYIGID